MVSGSGGLNWEIMKILEIELSMRWKGTTCLCGKLWDWIGYWDINGEERIVGSVGGGEGIVWSEFYVWNVAKWNCAESEKKSLGGLDLVVGEKETRFCMVTCGVLLRSRLWGTHVVSSIRWLWNKWWFWKRQYFFCNHSCDYKRSILREWDKRKLVAMLDNTKHKIWCPDM